MILSFRDDRTQIVFQGNKPKGLPPEILPRTVAKLLQLDGSSTLSDLLTPPSNRLEKLSGEREGQYSIRINRQWRLCFVWKDDNNAYEVEIVDYH